MIWDYWRLKKTLSEKESMIETLCNSNKRLMEEVKRLTKRENVLEGRLRAMRDDVSVAGMMQVEIQAKLDDLRLSVKGVRKGALRFLELTEDPMESQADPNPPPPADHLDDLRDMVGLKRDGSDVLRGDPRMSGGTARGY